MKKIFTLFLLLPAFALLAQNCPSPTDATTYQNGFNAIAVQQGDQLKLVKATRFIGDKCLLASQVKNMALLFAEDSVRLDFCKTAYAHTYDVANFYDVYDAFRHFSYAIRLYDYVQQHNKMAVQVNTEPPRAAEPAFPNYAYPDTARYAGKKGCAGPVMKDAAFRQNAQNIFSQPTDESKYVALQGAVDQGCISFAQLMKFTSLMKSDNFRMKGLVYGFPRVYDQEHYQSGMVLFSTTQGQNEWTNYAKTYLTPPPPECKTNDADFKKLLADLQAKRFPDEKMTMMELISKDRCFTVAQIKSFGKEFSFGEEKLKVFKMLYAKCNDQNNYYQLVDELTFSSEKEDLKRFIANGGK